MSQGLRLLDYQLKYGQHRMNKTCKLKKSQTTSGKQTKPKKDKSLSTTGKGKKECRKPGRPKSGNSDKRSSATACDNGGEGYESDRQHKMPFERAENGAVSSIEDGAALLSDKDERSPATEGGKDSDASGEKALLPSNTNTQLCSLYPQVQLKRLVLNYSTSGEDIGNSRKRSHAKSELDNSNDSRAFSNPQSGSDPHCMTERNPLYETDYSNDHSEKEPSRVHSPSQSSVRKKQRRSKMQKSVAISSTQPSSSSSSVEEETKLRSDNQLTNDARQENCNFAEKRSSTSPADEPALLPINGKEDEVLMDWLGENDEGDSADTDDEWTPAHKGKPKPCCAWPHRKGIRSKDGDKPANSRVMCKEKTEKRKRKTPQYSNAFVLVTRTPPPPNMSDKESQKMITKPPKKKKKKEKKKKKHNPLSEPTDCKICGKRLARGYSMSKHMVVHKRDRKPAVCLICGEKFRHAHAMKIHMFTHTRKSTYKCAICGENCRNRSSLLHHNQNHRKYHQVYDCDLCLLALPTPEDRREHFVAEHGPQGSCRIWCGLCKEVIPEHDDLVKHFTEQPDKHTLPKSDYLTWQCTTCKRAFLSLRTFTFHQSLTKHPAPISDEEFMEKLRPHPNSVRLPAPRVKKYACHLCSESFFYPTSLIRHQHHIHAEKHSFLCPYCSLLFMTQRHFDRHSCRERDAHLANGMGIPTSEQVEGLEQEEDELSTLGKEKQEGALGPKIPKEEKQAMENDHLPAMSETEDKRAGEFSGDGKGEEVILQQRQEDSGDEEREAITDCGTEGRDFVGDDAEGQLERGRDKAERDGEKDDRRVLIKRKTEEECDGQESPLPDNIDIVIKHEPLLHGYEGHGDTFEQNGQLSTSVSTSRPWLRLANGNSLLSDSQDEQVVSVRREKLAGLCKLWQNLSNSQHQQKETAQPMLEEREMRTRQEDMGGQEVHSNQQQQQPIPQQCYEDYLQQWHQLTWQQQHMLLQQQQWQQYHWQKQLLWQQVQSSQQWPQGHYAYQSNTDCANHAT